MSELEKKFYNWLMSNYSVSLKPEKIAKELAEIAEKYYDLYDDLIADMDYAIKELQKENKDLWEMNKILADSRLKILGENQELKKRHEELIFMLAEKDKQIADIKYLDGDEVEKIMMNFAHDCGGTSILISLKEKYITAICSLAIPESPRNLTKEELAKEKKYEKDNYKTFAIPITKEKIIKILEKYMNKYSGDVNIGYFKAIATEILGDDDENNI